MEITRRTFLFGSLAVVTQQRLDKAAVSDFDQFLTRVMDTGLVPGLSVSAVRGTDIVYSRGFGFADRETRRPVSIDTQFYIASTTKSFTALAASLTETTELSSCGEGRSQEIGQEDRRHLQNHYKL